MGELQYGVTAAADPLTQMYRRRRVQAILDRLEVPSFDVAAAKYYGTIAALVRHHGRNPRPRRMGFADRRDRCPPRLDAADPKRQGLRWFWSPHSRWSTCRTWPNPYAAKPHPLVG